MIDVRAFSHEVIEAFKARYSAHFDGNENAEFTEDLARMIAIIAAIAIEKYDREHQEQHPS